jgi:hypothetical protein
VKLKVRTGNTDAKSINFLKSLKGLYSVSYPGKQDGVKVNKELEYSTIRRE